MAVESATDRAALLADFGVTGTVGAETLTGILDAEYVDMTVGDAGHEGTDPRFLCRDADIASIGIVMGTAITIESTAYTVVGIQPDGTGFSELVLED